MSAKVVEANETRGTGPTFDHWPASLPQVSYVVADGGYLCVQCANGGNGSRAADDDIDATCPSDNQWCIIGAQVNAEPTECAHCGRMILSESGKSAL